MAQVTPYDYGISVSDVPAWAAALSALGFEQAEEANAGRPVPVGEPLATFVHPRSTQRIRLYPRDGVVPPSPAEGDVTIGIPVDGTPEAALTAVQSAAPGLTVAGVEDLPKEKGIAIVLDGQRLILTAKPEPFTVIHYRAEAWPEVLEFYEDVLGFCFFQLPDRGNAVRTRLENAAGRVDLEASPDTAPRPPAARGHFRLVNGKLEQAAERMPASPHGRWVAPPDDERAWVEGPAGEVMEVVAKPTVQG